MIFKVRNKFDSLCSIPHSQFSEICFTMNKAQILQEIKRTTEENGGAPIGQGKFQNETGIKIWNWQKFWSRWSEALHEAGFTPNQLNGAFDESAILEKYIRLAQELGKLPTKGDLIFRTNNDPKFPHASTYEKRFGSKIELIKKLGEFCKSRNEYKDVALLCIEYISSNGNVSEDVSHNSSISEDGYVYLIKSGRFHKIGRANSAGRREYELALQLPEKASTVHVIRTDDPNGIEAYWHNRFAAKRKNGEWFELNATDISIFKRRKFM